MLITEFKIKRKEGGGNMGLFHIPVFRQPKGSWAKVFSIYFSLYLFAYLLFSLGQGIIFLHILVIIAPIFFLLYWATTKYADCLFIIVFFCLFSIFVLSASIVQTRPLLRTCYLLFVFFANIFLAYVFSREAISIKIFYFYFITVCLFFFWFALNSSSYEFQYEYYEYEGKNIKNMTSWLLLTASSLVYLSVYQQQKSNIYPLWPAAFSFVISLWAAGRSGIFSTGLLLSGVIISNVIRSGFILKTTLVSVFSLTLSTYFLYIILPMSAILQNVVTRFGVAQLKSEGRALLTSFYLDKISNLRNFFFGYNIQESSFMNLWNFNLHNSFLNLHFVMGIGSLFLVVCICRGIWLKGKENPLIWAVGGALLIRIFTDTGALFGQMDFLLFYFCFMEKSLLSKKIGKGKRNLVTKLNHVS